VQETPVFIPLSDGRLRMQVHESAAGLVLGRVEQGGDFTPDVDLTPYNAQDSGVSRRHAALVQYNDRLHLIDLESANGSSLNGRRLSPNIPYRLKDGDQIRLGSLTLFLSIVTE